MKLSEIAMLTILIIGLLLGTFQIQGDILEKAGVANATDESVVAFKGVEDLKNQGEKIEERILDLSKKATSLDLTSVYDMAALFADVGVYLFKIPNAILAIITGVPRLLLGTVPISGWFTTTLIAIVMIAIALKIVAIFLKRDDI